MDPTPRSSLWKSAALLAAVLSITHSTSTQDSREVARDLSAAVESGDHGAFVSAFEAAMGAADPALVRSAVDSYAKMAERLAAKKSWEDAYFVHSKAAAAFGKLSDRECLVEVKKLKARKGSDWRTRLLLLDAAAFQKELDLEASAVEALKDSAPQVVRRALSYLVHTKKVSVVETMVARIEELEAKKPRKDAAEWDRTLLSFQSALEQIFGVHLTLAKDWRNFVDARKDRPDFFTPRTGSGGASGLSLFGAAVTGKNIVFVLDVSGSMLTTDPLPPGKKDEQRGTVVVDAEGRRIGGRGPPPPPLEERRRIHRAKRELVRVINALPSGVKFNVVSYSSDVNPWQKRLLPSTAENKKTATAFVEELRADGITVTDMALEEAFADLDVDTIYLLTDGAPTHVGNSIGEKPEDSDQLIAEIHKRTEVLNFLRHVRIFSLGFQGAEENFLKKLSKDNWGRYVRIE